jgi:hypothetical protein
MAQQANNGKNTSSFAMTGVLMEGEANSSAADASKFPPAQAERRNKKKKVSQKAHITHACWSLPPSSGRFCCGGKW